jgi:hypothetical protein
MTTTAITDDRRYGAFSAIVRYIDEHLLEKLAARLHGIDPLDEVAEVSFLHLTRQLREHEQQQPREQGDEHARLVRVGPRADEETEASERHGQNGAEDRPQPQRLPKHVVPLGDDHQGRYRDEVCGRPGCERGKELPEHELSAARRRQQQHLERPAFAFSADAVGPDDHPDEHAERDCVLQRQERHLLGRDQIQFAVRRQQECHQPKQDAVQDQQVDRPASDPQLNRLLPEHHQPAASRRSAALLLRGALYGRHAHDKLSDVSSMKTSARRVPSISNPSTGTSAVIRWSRISFAARSAVTGRSARPTTTRT